MEAGSALLASQKRLELQCLLQQLEELSQGVEALLLNQTDQACDTRAVLAEAGHAAPAAAYRSLSQHVAAAGAMQRLRLPSQHPQPAAAVAPAAAADAEQSDTLPVQDGSRQHLLGLTPQALKQQCIPSKKAAQAAHAPLRPEVEAQLAQLVEQLVEHLDVPADDPQPHVQLLHMAAAHKAAAAAEEAAALQQVAACTSQAAAHLAALRRVQALLTELVEDCMLNKQRSYDMVHAKRLIKHISALFSKSKVLEVQLQQETYTPDTLPALRRVAELLEAEEAGLGAALEKVGSQVRAYEACGADYEELVQEYLSIKAEQHNVTFALKRFNELEEEMGGPGAHSS